MHRETTTGTQVSFDIDPTDGRSRTSDDFERNFLFCRCKASFIVVCIVAWDGMPKMDADNAYRLLIHKLNKFGLPTTRRCATNENRTCACQGK